jgi:hypothetical protein
MTSEPAFGCPDKEQLIAYVYGEATEEEGAAIARHLPGCAACAADEAGLRRVRTTLAAWRPPEVALGFRIVRGREVGTPWWRRGSLWAAAAALLLATAAVVAKVEVRVDRDGIVVRAGGGSAAASAAAPRPAKPWLADLAALEQRLRRELASTHPAPAPLARGVDEAALLRRVRALIEASEARQQRELAWRVAQVASEMHAQRQADLLRIEQRFGHLAGLTGLEVAKQRELMNYLLRVSSRRPE